MVDVIKISAFPSQGSMENDFISTGLSGGLNTNAINSWVFLPPGTTGDRPTPAASMYYRLRLNTTLETYEYYDPTVLLWVPLSGSGTGTVNPGVTNDLAFYASSGQTVSPINGAVNSVLTTNGAGLPALRTTLPTGLTIPGATITGSTAALTAGSVVAAPSAGTDIANKTYVDSILAGAVTSITGTTNQIIASSPTGAVTLSLPQDIATGSTPTFLGLTLSTIPLGSSSGGTGIDNGTKTLTLGGNTVFSGAFASTFTMTGVTTVTFPTSGTLATVANTVSSLTGTANQITASSPTGAVTIALASNAVLPGTGGVTIPQGNTAARAGGAGTIRFNTQTSVFESTVDGVAWSTIQTAAIGVTSVSGTANRITASPTTGAVIVDISASYVGQSSITTLGTIGTGVWQGTTVAVGFGGTGVTSVTTAPTATAFAGWDANANLSADNFLWGYATTATAAGTTTLTVDSKYNQYFTGVTTQNCDLPVTSTLVLGQSYLINNLSTGVVTVRSSGGNTITAMAAGTSALFTCILTSGTTAASWNSDYQSVGVPVTVSQGGTSGTSFTAYSPIIAGTTATGAFQSMTIGAAGTIMQSGGAASLPTYSTATYPSTTTVSQILYSSSTNVVGGITTANSAMLVTNSSGVPAMSGTMTNGQLIIGSTTATPTAATLTAGNGITITNGAASITLASPGSLKSFQVFTSGTAATYTKPAGITSILVELVGGGGRWWWIVRCKFSICWRWCWWWGWWICSSLDCISFIDL